MRGIAGFSCIRCGRLFPRDLEIDARGCPDCFEDAPANLRVTYDIDREPSTARAVMPRASSPSLWRYADMLPCTESEAVTLGEGLTPLLSAQVMGKRLGVPKLFIKDESKNPTWSHKDRFSTVAVSMARLNGARVVATASSGNAGASLAAYAARAGLKCVVVTFAGTAGAMLTQIRKHGATVLPLVDKSLRWPLLATCTQRFGWFATSPFHAPVVGSHPVGIEGYKTLAYEIVEQMHGDVPDWCVLPVCYGDALAGLWRGFNDLHSQGRIDRFPRLVAAEVHGSLARALAARSDVVSEVPARFDTLAISIGTTRSTFQALEALRASSGIAIPVGNSGLIDLQEELASTEGILAELTSVTPFAAIASLRRQHVIAETDSVVAVVTGSGLKDLDRSDKVGHRQPVFHSVNEALTLLHENGGLCAPGEATVW